MKKYHAFNEQRKQLLKKFDEGQKTRHELEHEDGECICSELNDKSAVTHDHDGVCFSSCADEFAPKAVTHTPTPWKYIGWDGQAEIRSADNSGIGIALLGNREDGPIPNVETRANAAYIVQCVNSHQELIEVLKDFAYYFKDQTNGTGLEERFKKAINRAEGKQS